MNTNFASLDGEALLKTLEQEAAAAGISDIHLSPQKNGVRLEWRLHGVLQTLGVLKFEQFEEMLRRIKFASKLKMNIANIPQDGQFTYQAQFKDADGKDQIRTINVRVATIPSRFGEAVTLRLLDPRKGIIPLERLGFPPAIREELQRLVELPNGLILVTGPTGSGKTTTLYALLSTIIGKQRNIITLEDPIEYEIGGIIQSETDPDHDYTFANGLRSILRHDPDVILVGEIRDLETAQTAVNAALTGHLVLSTLHTNSAAESVQRLLSMGVSPYTLAPALRAILAQRLVRTLKPELRDKNNLAGGSDDDFNGQTCLPELLLVSPTIQNMILSLENTSVLLEQARKEGFKALKEWGEELIASKVTTRAEIERITL